MSTVWTPPEGMDPKVTRAWREFYRKAASGGAGYTATPEEYVVMYLAQLGRCAICQSAKGIHPLDPKGKGAQRLGWDHNHATGALRGLLCTLGDRSCNRIVGWFRNRPEAFDRGAQYLRNPPAIALTESARIIADLGLGYSRDERVRLAKAIMWPGGVPGEPKRVNGSGHYGRVNIVDENTRWPNQ